MTSDKLWDPLRKKEVAATPEERVRQWFISFLKQNVGVPEHMMMSEVEMSFGQAGKTYRADILVYGKNLKPLVVVECKRPEVELTAETLNQALRYDMVLGVDYIFITNGNTTYAFHKEDGQLKTLKTIPGYIEICQQ